MLEDSLKTLHTGETVTGTVVTIGKNEIKLDLGTKVTGVLPKEQITDDPNAVLSEMKCEPLPTSPQGYVGTFDLNDYYKKLAIKTTASGELNITVKLTPLDGRTTDFTVDTTPLAQWKDKVTK